MGAIGVLSDVTFMHWRRKWQPTPVFLPGESQGWGRLVGCRLWGCTESDMTDRLHFHFHSHNLHFKITELARRFNPETVLRQDTLLYSPCKDQTYSHNLHFKVTNLARRFNPWTVAHQAPLSMGFTRQEYGWGCHFLLQGIFSTQGPNPGLLHCRQILYQLSFDY